MDAHERTLKQLTFRVEERITDHLRDLLPDLEKYKVVQNFPMWECRNKEDCNFLVILILKFWLLLIFEAKSWSKHITNI